MAAGLTGATGTLNLGGTTITLPNTAVTAGTYGDSTHVSQVTIGADGRVTGASNVAISASGSGNITSGAVTSANGFAGSATSGSATLNFTLSTTVTGTLWGNGTAISNATANQIAGNFSGSTVNITSTGNWINSGTNFAVSGLVGYGNSSFTNSLWSGSGNFTGTFGVQGATTLGGNTSLTNSTHSGTANFTSTINASGNVAITGNVNMTGTLNNISTSNFTGNLGMGANNITGTGNITAANFIGSGGLLTSNTILSSSFVANNSPSIGNVLEYVNSTASFWTNVTGGGGGNVTLWPAGVGYSNGTAASAATPNQIMTNATASTVNFSMSGNLIESGTNTAIAGLVATGNSTFTNSIFSGTANVSILNATGNSTFTNVLYSGNGNYTGTLGVQGASTFTGNVSTGNITMGGTTTIISSMTTAGLVANNSGGVLTSTNVSTGLSNSGGNLTVTAINPMVYANVSPAGTTIGTATSLGTNTVIQLQAANSTQNGIQLPTMATNKILFVRSPTTSTSNVTVYPQSPNSTINGGAANASISIAAGGAVMYMGSSSTNAQQITFFDPMLNYPIPGNWSFSGNESFSQAPFMSGANLTSNTVTALSLYANNSPSAGQVYAIGNISTGLGSWVNSSGSGSSATAITGFKRTVYTGGATWNAQSNTVWSVWHVQAAGGGMPALTGSNLAGGGGGGGYGDKQFTYAQANNVTVTVGAGSAGSIGGNSTLTINTGSGSTVNAIGGGISSTSASGVVGGIGGNCTGSDYPIPGGQGSYMTTTLQDGNGGNAFMGQGGIGSNGLSLAGQNYGGGAGGGYTSQAATAGGNGIVIVDEYTGTSVGGGGGGGGSSVVIHNYSSNQTVTGANSEVDIFSAGNATLGASTGSVNSVFTIKNSNATLAETITPNGADTIDGVNAAITIIPYQSIDLCPNSNTSPSGWVVIH